MKRIVISLGAAALLTGSFANMSMAKTDTTGSEKRGSLVPHVELSLPLMYGFVGAISLCAFGGMAYQLFKPIKHQKDSAISK